MVTPKSHEAVHEALAATPYDMKLIPRVRLHDQRALVAIVLSPPEISRPLRQLEQYVSEQVADGTYDFSANKMLLKLCVALCCWRPRHRGWAVAGVVLVGLA